MRIECGDRRLDLAGYDLHEAMVKQQSVCLRQLGGRRAGEMRYGRLLRNERVSVQKLIEGACEGIGQRTAGRHVLLLQDTTELNYQAHAGRTRGLGRVGNGTDMGLFIHPVLCVDAQEGTCLGLAHLHLWQRTKAKATDYRKQPIENKESVRWIEAIVQARARLGQTERITVIADRESDIYEMWERLPDERTHLLIRACRDRKIADDQGGAHLFEWLSILPEQGRYSLNLPARTGGRGARIAQLQVRFASVRIARPCHCSDKSAADSVALWAIEVREAPDTDIANRATDKPIHWRLLTTHAVQTLQQALCCVHWYTQRWHIEQTFRALKSQGLDVESSLIEEASRLEKLAVIACSAAVHTMQLTLARDGNNRRPASDCFDAQQQEVMKQVGATLEGKTVKQRNPHQVFTLAWAAWIVARLGGWKGYASERPPGPITMLNGLKAFNNILYGWMIARSSEGGRDVCIH